MLNSEKLWLIPPLHFHVVSSCRKMFSWVIRSWHC